MLLSVLEFWFSHCELFEYYYKILKIIITKIYLDSYAVHCFQAKGVWIKMAARKELAPLSMAEVAIGVLKSVASLYIYFAGVIAFFHRLMDEENFISFVEVKKKRTRTDVTEPHGEIFLCCQ
jgi:hypothetical protein